MPEVGLLYILSSSDPLCGGEGHVRLSETNTQTKPNIPVAECNTDRCYMSDVSFLLEVDSVPRHSTQAEPQKGLLYLADLA